MKEGYEYYVARKYKQIMQSATTCLELKKKKNQGM